MKATLLSSKLIQCSFRPIQGIFNTLHLNVGYQAKSEVRVGEVRVIENPAIQAYRSTIAENSLPHFKFSDSMEKLKDCCVCYY